mmetsp:Transcript_1203/g.4915  ORF Transcript_1203/g.4915 Transcript_1203/m.4915 type:complete len:313 (-) Transcript_1203:124-1062(-)
MDGGTGKHSSDEVALLSVPSALDSDRSGAQEPSVHDLFVADVHGPVTMSTEVPGVVQAHLIDPSHAGGGDQQHGGGQVAGAPTAPGVPTPPQFTPKKSWGATRRAIGFWEPFNQWWREEHKRLQRRPTTDEITTWFETMAHDTWGTHAPTLADARKHAKCLRPVDEVRDYFRKYRAKKAKTSDNPDRQARMDQGQYQPLVMPPPEQGGMMAAVAAAAAVAGGGGDPGQNGVSAVNPGSLIDTAMNIPGVAGMGLPPQMPSGPTVSAIAAIVGDKMNPGTAITPLSGPLDLAAAEAAAPSGGAQEAGGGEGQG